MPSRTEVSFPGSSGAMLSGLLELPDADVTSFVLMAHCFTCGKDMAAASRIARVLVTKGYGVLRFDFTGLGNSDGDFSNTNFSSNVMDLLSAANFLSEHYRSPSLLIGHSLGGTAVLVAAQSLHDVKGVVTIGSPAEATHVLKQFSCDLQKIEEQGDALVNLAGRTFTIKKQFLDDINHSADVASIGKMKKALLVFHSPVDEIVSIEQAEIIYSAARHPKSFVSLDNANHLLTKKEDAIYVAELIGSWSKRYLSD